jgi:hypothetical protein
MPDRYDEWLSTEPDGEEAEQMTPAAELLRQIWNPEGHEEVTHRCPAPSGAGGDGLMPCCGRTPFQVPPYHRMTLHEELVTCTGTAPASTGESADA